jgi:hypothetical protein
MRGRFRHFPADDPRATLVLGHGAGGSGTPPDLQALADALPGDGITVILHEQPWKVAGKKVASAPPVLDAAWIEDLDALKGPLVVGGRSAGARVACRTAAAVGAVAVVALAFPLHPPGKPEKSRAEELGVGVPLRVVQGQRDPFGRPAEFPAGLDLVAVPGDHSLRQGIPQVVDAVREFVVGMAGR